MAGGVNHKETDLATYNQDGGMSLYRPSKAMIQKHGTCRSTDQAGTQLDDIFLLSTGWRDIPLELHGTTKPRKRAAWLTRLGRRR